MAGYYLQMKPIELSGRLALMPNLILNFRLRVVSYRRGSITMGFDLPK